jgi:hypothetical protein
LCARDVDTKPTEPGNLAYLLDAPHPVWRTGDSQQGRKLQTPTFRDKRALRQACIDVCHEAADERGKPQQMDAASADAFGAMCVSLALICATASPALSFSQGTPEQRGYQMDRGGNEATAQRERGHWNSQKRRMIKDRSDVCSQNEVCSGEQHGAAQAL